MATSFLPLKPDNPALRLADKIDVKLSNTPVRFWMRAVCLVWQS
jgi:hypothetical protein